LDFLTPVKIRRAMGEISGEDVGQSSAVPKHVIDFRYIASFRNYNSSKEAEVKN